MTKKTNKDKVVFFSIADNNNLPYYEKMRNSLLYFHPTADLKIVGPGELNDILPKDNMFYYRATPTIAWNLFNEGYDTVVKIDADSIITGKLDHTWKGDFDIGVVNNSNPREVKKYPYTVWNIHPLSYLNCGYVVMKSKAFVKHWLKLCASPHFQHYQMREQDLLNIMVFYMNTGMDGPYKVEFLDASKYTHGLVTKGYWLDFVLKDKKLILPKNEEWNQEDKEVKVIHWAGGNQPNKMNFNTQFKPEVAKWLKTISG